MSRREEQTTKVNLLWPYFQLLELHTMLNSILYRLPKNMSRREEQTTKDNLLWPYFQLLELHTMLNSS